MRGVNRVIILGNVGQDPEVRSFAGGQGTVTTVSIATSESWKDKNTGQVQEATEWHRVVFYGRLAEIVGEYVRKGSKLYVEGSIHTRKWQDKNTGQDRYSTEIKAASMQLLDSKSGGGNGGGRNEYDQSEDRSQGGRQQRQQPQNHSNNDFDDDLPF